MTPSRTPTADFQLFSVPAHPTGQPESVKGKDIGSSKQRVEVDDVLLCKINPRINRVWRVTDSGTGTPIASTEWIRFASHSDVEPDFLRFFLMRDEVKEYLAANASGVGGSLMRVRPSTVDPVAFPLPARQVQRAIVARIDELFANLDDGEAALRRARADLVTWRKALLKAAVTGELTADWRAANPSTETGADLLARILIERRERWHAAPRNKGKSYNDPPEPIMSSLPDLPKEWIWASLGQIAAIGSGTTPSRNNPNYWGGAIPWLKSGCVNNVVVRSAEEYISDLAARELRLKTVPKGTLLIALYGEGKTRGKCAITEIEATVNQAIGTVQAYKDIFPPWIKTAIDSDYEKNRLISSGGVQPNLNLIKLSTLPIPLPPINEQRAAVELLVKASEAQRDAIDLCSAANDMPATLRQSILAAAFRGDFAP